MLHTLTRTMWRRAALVFISALGLAHVLAAWGLKLGMPDAPYGDEQRHLFLWIEATLRTVWMPWEPLNVDAIAPAALSRGLVPVVCLWFGGEGIFYLFARVVRVRLALRRGGHYVIAPVSSFGIRLGRQWLAQDYAVVAVCANDADTHSARVAGMGAVKASWGTSDSFDACALSKAQTVLISGAADLTNIASAKAAADYVIARRAPEMPPLSVVLEVNDPFLRAQINERLDRFGHLEAVQLRLVSPAQVAARRLFRDQPFNRFSQSTLSAPHLWIIGMGRMGEEIAIGAPKLGHFANGKCVSLTLVDQRIDDVRSSLTARWPGIPTVAHVDFVQGAAENAQTWTKRALNPPWQDDALPSAIYFCLGSDEINAALVAKVAATLVEFGQVVPPIYVRRTSAGSGTLPIELSDAHWVDCFGDVEWVADGALSALEDMDRLARRIHERYLSEAAARGEAPGSRRSLQPWVLLDEDLKDDNRTVADHHYVKIGDCGCRVLPATENSVAFAFTPEEVEQLAEAEHRRWMASRLLTGWQYGTVRDDASKRHPDIVPYAALAEDRKELDRAVVRELPALFAEIGMVIVREVRIMVTGPKTHWAFTSEFDGAVAAELLSLKQQAKERPLVLVSDLDSALACRVAEIALEKGLGEVSLILRESPGRLVDRQTDPTIKARLRRLLVAAKSIRLKAAQELVLAEPTSSHDIVWATSIDGAELPRADNVLGMDASGRVLRRPQGVQHATR